MKHVIHLYLMRPGIASGFKDSHRLEPHLKLVATGYKLPVGAFEEVMADDKLHVLVPARVWALHMGGTLVHSGKNSFVIEGPLAALHVCAPVEIPEAGNPAP